MRRLAASTFALVVMLLLLAPAALALGTHGEGLYGETDDKVVTNAGFILIAAFPAFITIMSLLQWRLEKRKDARKAAAKAHSVPPELRSGW